MARTATRTRARNTVADVPEYVAPVGDTALTTGTVETPADPETPKAGDNSGETMIDPAVTHAALDATLHLIFDTERKLDHERQRLSAHLLTRHLYLRATDPTTPDLADMAMNAWLVGKDIRLPNGDKQPAMYSGYLITLVNEYGGKFVPEREQTTNAMKEAARYREMVNTRLDRALRLLCNIAWLRRPSNNDVPRWDEETSRWFVPAIGFVPHGWRASGQMLYESDAVDAKIRDGVWLEPDNDTKLSCFITALEGNAPPKRIVQSLDQLTHAVTSQIEAAHKGKTAEAAEATRKAAADKAAEVKAAADTVAAQRAPQMAGSRNASAPTPDATPADADTDADADAPTPMQDRANWVRLFNQHTTAQRKLIEMGLKMERGDFTPETWNDATEVAIFLVFQIPLLGQAVKQARLDSQLKKTGRAA